MSKNPAFKIWHVEDDVTKGQLRPNVQIDAILDPPSWISKFSQNARKPPK